MPFLVEAFATSNLAFLALDTWLAHATNSFARPAEWTPVVFSAAGAATLGVNLVLARLRGTPFERGPGRAIGFAVGWAGILVGGTGLVLHLGSRFFQDLTLRSLVYSAPFVAPLSFTGLGFLVLLPRMVDPRSADWARWVLFLALGGFAWSLALALTDHAQNGFFYPAEWLAVGAAALAAGYLVALFAAPSGSGFRRAGFVVLAFEAAIGVLGFILHDLPALHEAGEPLLYRVVFGAPKFAPLLFTDLAALGAIGLVGLLEREPSPAPGEAAAHTA